MGLERLVRGAWNALRTVRRVAARGTVNLLQRVGPSIRRTTKRVTAGIVEVLDGFSSMAHWYQRMRYGIDRFHPRSYNTISKKVFQWAYSGRREDYTKKDHLPRVLGNIIAGKIGLGYLSYLSAPYLGWMMPQWSYDFVRGIADSIGVSQNVADAYVASHPGFFASPIIFAAVQLGKHVYTKTRDAVASFYHGVRDLVPRPMPQPV